MTNLDSAKGIKLEPPKGLALEPPKGLTLEPSRGLVLKPSVPVDPPMPPLAMCELMGDGPTLDPWEDETFVCEIDDLY